MKTRNLLLTLFAISSCVLTGCKNKNKQTGRMYTSVDQLGEFDTTKDVVITFYHTMGQDLQQVLANYITVFNREYPNIKVEPMMLGGYSDVRDQLTTELSVGSSANLTYCYADHVASYLATGKVLDLDIMANDTKYGYGFTEAQRNDFVESYYNEGKSFGDGHLYMLPFSKSTEVLYYDKDEFDRLELEVPTHWVSSDDNDKTSMEYACKTLKQAHPNDCPLGYDSSANLFITLAEQTKAGYTTVEEPHYIFNNAKNKENAALMRKWHKDGWLETKLTYGQYTSGLFTQTGKDKDNNPLPRCYMCIGSSAGAVYQANVQGTGFETGIAPIPQADENNKKVISQGPSVCIFEDSDTQKVIASWLFLKFLTTSVKFQAEFSMKSGYVPVIKSVFNNPTYNTFLSRANGYADYIQAKSCQQCVSMQNDFFTSVAFDGSADCREIVDKMIYKIMIEKDDTYNIDNIFAKAVSDCVTADA